MELRQWQIKSTWGLIRCHSDYPFSLYLSFSLSFSVIRLITAVTGYLFQLPARSSDWLLPPSSISLTLLKFIKQKCYTRMWKMNLAFLPLFEKTTWWHLGVLAHQTYLWAAFTINVNNKIFKNVLKSFCLTSCVLPLCFLLLSLTEFYSTYIPADI